MSVLSPARGADRGERAGIAERGGAPRLARGALAVVVLCFAAFSASRMFPPQPYGLADDWRVFYAAATVTAHGGSPYDPALIHPAEQAADHYASVQPSLDDFVNLPIVAWALRPLTALPFWAAYGLAAGLGIVAAATMLMAWLRRLGWRRRTAWTAAALLSWPALLGVYSGQFDLLLLAAMVGAMMLTMRGRSGLAGALCAAAVVVKPHILWPLPLLLAAAQLPDRRGAARCLGAAAATAALAVGAGELLMPGTTSAFLTHLLAFGGRIADVQPDLAGLPGMVERLPGGGMLAAGIAAAGVILTVAFAAWWGLSARALAVAPRLRGPLGVCAGMAIWLVATPYAHPNDDVLLFPLLALVLGAGAAGARQRDLARALAGCAALVAAYVVAVPAGMVVTLVLAAALWRARARRSALAAAALVSLAILPMAWPFHVLPVSLTPLAVIAVAAAGGALVRAAVVVRAECSRAFAPAG